MNLKNKEILIVEDDETASSMLCALVKDSGYSFFVVSSVAGTFGYLKNNVPDLIILDLKLPDGYGLDISRVCKKGPRLGRHTDNSFDRGE